MYVSHLLTYIYIYTFKYFDNGLHSVVYFLLHYMMISYEVQYVNNVIELCVLFEKLNESLNDTIVKNNQVYPFNKEKNGTLKRNRDFELWEICDMHWTLCQSIEHHINGHFSLRLMDGWCYHNLFGHLYSTSRIQCLEHPQDSHLVTKQDRIFTGTNDAIF
ncbi:hypothetical protein WDU94_003412 [Cyamophila willieti]